MKRVFKLAALALLLLSATIRAQGFTGSLFFIIPPDDLKQPDASADVERTGVKPDIAPLRAGASFAISKFDEEIVAEFSHVWRKAGNGTMPTEGVALILKMADGSFRAKSQGFTNEYKKFTFNWHPGAIAIVHTHPNNADPRPLEDDIKTADRLRIPVFTITARGMYVYDPFTKKISKVLDGLDWLEYKNYTTRDPLRGFPGAGSPTDKDAPMNTENGASQASRISSVFICAGLSVFICGVAAYHAFRPICHNILCVHPKIISPFAHPT